MPRAFARHYDPGFNPTFWAASGGVRTLRPHLRHIVNVRNIAPTGEKDRLVTLFLQDADIQPRWDASPRTKFATRHVTHGVVFTHPRSILTA